MNKTTKILTILITIFCALCTSLTGQDKPAKLTVEEVIRKHQASLGSSSDLAAIKSRVMIGTGKVNSLIGLVAEKNELTGVAQFASEGDKSLFAIVFDSNIYIYEKGAYDGDNITVGLGLSNQRSSLGNFLKGQGQIFKQGLFGGTLSSAWALANLAAKRPKIEYAGTEKIDDRQLYKLRYYPDGGSTLRISLYFDAETFQHIFSEYEYVQSPRAVSDPTQASQQRERRFKMVEQFSDFRREGGIILPHTYSIDFTIQGDNTESRRYTMNFSQFVFNEQLGAEAFRVS